MLCKLLFHFPEWREASAIKVLIVTISEKIPSDVPKQEHCFDSPFCYSTEESFRCLIGLQEPEAAELHAPSCECFRIPHRILREESKSRLSNSGDVPRVEIREENYQDSCNIGRHLLSNQSIFRIIIFDIHTETLNNNLGQKHTIR